MKSDVEITNDMIQALYKEWNIASKSKIINERVSILFRNWRLAWLLKEWEMFDLISKVEYELDEVKLSKYLDILEYHIQYIDPHTKIVTINDEDTPVFFLTKGPEMGFE
jgi:hypothetical protein